MKDVQENELQQLLEIELEEAFEEAIKKDRYGGDELFFVQFTVQIQNKDQTKVHVGNMKARQATGCHIALSKFVCDTPTKLNIHTGTLCLLIEVKRAGLEGDWLSTKLSEYRLPVAIAE